MNESVLAIEYQLTLEDEINSINLTKKYTANLPLLHWQVGYIVPLIILLSNLPSIANFRETNILGLLLQLVCALLCFPQIQVKIPTHSWLQKYQIKKAWRENHHQVKSRKIIVIETEFIFIKEQQFLFISEPEQKSWQWQNLKYYLVNETGFILEFFGDLFVPVTDKQRFIPKHAFITEAQIDRFRETLSKHGKQIGNY